VAAVLAGDLAALLIHVGFFTFTLTGWWMASVRWFVDLPL